MAKAVTLLDIKKYFEETSSAKFAKEWKTLDDSDRQEIRVLVAEALKKV